MQDAYICDFTRTPIGRYAGALRDVRTDDLAAHPIRVLKERNPGVDWDALDDCYMGCANQAGEDNRNVARMAVLLAGLPTAVPGATINRLCGSGLDAVGTAARAIRSGRDGAGAGRRGGKHDPRALRDGQEQRSLLPPGRDLRHHHRLALRQRPDEDDVRHRFHAGNRRERRRGIPDQPRRPGRLRTAQPAESREGAQASGFFAREITPVTLKTRKGETIVDRDEHPRPDTTMEMLAKLKTPFRSPGSVTAGNASGVNDGAAALLLASEAAAKRHGLTPRARVVAMATAGVPPRIMGIGPAPAVRKLLERTGLALGDIDVIELNEAFASQSLAVLRQLGLPDDAEHVNPHGGAIALGHPLGASGARLAMTAVNALEETGARRAIATMCIGVGQGIAALIERV